MPTECTGMDMTMGLMMDMQKATGTEEAIIAISTTIIATDGILLIGLE
jgi:hypothetical protein